MVADRQGHGDPDVVPTIAALIRAHRDRTGDSYDDLAQRAGGVVTRQQLWRLEHKPVRGFPRQVETIPAVAAALNVDVTAVVLGYAASLGLEVRRSGAAIILPQDAGQLTDHGKKLVRDFIRELLEARKATEEQTAAEVIRRKRAQRTAAKQPPSERTTPDSNDRTADG